MAQAVMYEMGFPMMRRCSTSSSERSGRKRNASEIEDPETAPSPSRTRISIKQEPNEVNDRDPSADDRDYDATAADASQLHNGSHDIGDVGPLLDELRKRVTNGVEDGGSDIAVDIKDEDSEDGSEEESEEESEDWNEEDDEEESEEESENECEEESENAAKSTSGGGSAIEPEISARVKSASRIGNTIGPKPTHSPHGSQQPDGDRSDQIPERPSAEARTRGEMNDRGKLRQRALAAKIAVPRGIPRSYREADAADRMMVRMKEKGRSWAEIRMAWEKKTGQKTANSTLPNRWSRLKDNIDRLKPGDGRRLVAAESEVEETYRRDKWELVAQAIKRAGGESYKPSFIRKAFGEILEDPSKIDHESEGDWDPDAVESSASPAVENPPCTEVTLLENAPNSEIAVSCTADTQAPKDNGSSVTESIPKSTNATVPSNNERPQATAVQQTPKEMPLSAVAPPPAAIGTKSKGDVMKAVWARRQAEGTNGRHGGAPTAGTVAKAHIELEKSPKEMPATQVKIPKKHEQPKSRRISKRELKYMIKHRTLNKVNRSKGWDVVAQECGIISSLPEISRAHEKAGYPSIV